MQTVLVGVSRYFRLCRGRGRRSIGARNVAGSQDAAYGDARGCRGRADLVGRMKEDDRLFEADVVKSGNKWFWRARAHGLEEFCRAREPDWLPLDAAGWLNVGPYKTRWAAGRDLKDFEEEFRDFLQQEKLPGLKIKNAPDPSLLS